MSVQVNYLPKESIYLLASVVPLTCGDFNMTCLTFLLDYTKPTHCIRYQNTEEEAQLMLTNPHDAFRGQSRSPNMVPFDRLGMVSYSNFVPKTLFLRYLTSRNVMTLKSWSEVTQSHRN